MTPHGSGLLRIHVAVVFFGLAGLLGKLTTATPATIVFTRTLLAAAALWPAAILSGRVRALARTEALAIAAAGLVLAAHWQTFFLAVKLSTVALALLTYSSFPLFVTFLEPLFLRTRLRARDVAAAIVVLAGLALIAPPLDPASAMTQGAAWGIASGFTFAVFTLINRRFAPRVAPVLLAAGENTVAAAALAPFLGAAAFDLGPRDLALLAALGLICTALAHLLFMQGLARVRAHVAAVIATLEPVYGIVFAALVLSELPEPRTLLGGAIIIGGAAYASLRERPGGSGGGAQRSISFP